MKEEILPLFDGPFSHSGDPCTSVIVAHRLRRSGRYKGQKQRVYEALQGHQGSTSAELATYMGNVDRYMTARRLPDLERDGKVRKGKVRTCTVTGSPSVTWFINQAEGDIV